ncbi:TolC family protein [Paracandidimonas lactea]|uniref:TolC family protein n=1 Tax=Paracandidimonas lactea TaxID=2895524 RepID=UPI001EFFAADC|nr:TolC family protein [Paracandidimonas lactea]
MFELVRALASQRATMRGRALSALLALASASAYGQGVGLTLEAALSQATNRSAAIQASQASVLASTHAVVKAGELPDPVLKVGIDNVPIDGPQRYSISQDFMTMRHIGIEQEWVSSDKRERRSSLANRVLDKERAGALAQFANTRQQTVIAWLNAAYAQRALELSRALVNHMTHELAATRASYQGAEASADDVTQAQIMLSQAEDQLLKAKQTSRSALIALSRWVASPVDGVSGDIPQLESRVSSLTLEELNQVQPALLTAWREISVADADTSVASSNRTPNWTWGVTYQQRGSQYSNMVSVGVSIPLPISRENRQDRDVAEKAALGNKARLMLRESQREVQANIQNLSTSLANGRERIRNLNRSLLPAAERQVRLMTAAYKAGTGTLASVFNAKRSQLDAKLQIVDLERDVAQIWAQLEYQVIPKNISLGQ